MPSKKKKAIVPPKEHIELQKITDTLELNYMPYAMSVIVSRAIPEIDGFKPSHRKLLYTMYKAGLLKGDRKKSSAVVGDTMKLNPHGDAAIYETMVRLTEGNGALLHAFVDSKGNFGKQYSRDMAYAAPRYTEVKLSAICAEIFTDIDKDTVDFVDNFDSSLKEPLLLPTSFPNVLVNPNQGIAVGMASSICSFNLKEICETTIQYIKNEKCDILKTLKAPDFPTGGEIIYHEDTLRSIYETGRGSIRVRAKYRFDSENNCIEIFEIPYTTNLEIIIDKIIALVKASKIKDITEIRDETDLKGLKIAIDIKKNTDPHLLMHRLYQLTPLSDTFSCNFNILIHSRPVTLGVRGILREWVAFRSSSLKRQTAYDIRKKQEKQHLLEGLAKILMDIDKAISIIRHTEQEVKVIPNLMVGFEIDAIQAEYIAEIKLRNINKEYIVNRIQELDTLKNEVKALQEILESDSKIKNLICAQLRGVARKYGKERKTSIITEDDILDVSEDTFVENYGIRLYLTAENYFKKIPLTSLRATSEQKLKEEDSILFEEESTNKADILLFSNMQSIYKLKANDVTDCKASSLGDYLGNLLGLDAEEKIIYMTSTLDYTGFMLFVFENGKVAKISLDSYATKVNRKKLVNAYCAKSPLVYAAKIETDIDILLMRGKDKATLIHTSQISVTATKNSAGIQVYTLKKNSHVSAAYPGDTFDCENIEYYRASKIPTTGHFIKESDKEKNNIPVQIKI